MAETPARPTALAVLLTVGGIVGLVAAFALTIDKIGVLEHPHVHSNCYVNPLVQCDTNLKSWQGAVFGFPNPLIGLAAFPAPIFMGVSTLAGVRFPRWIWALFNAGMAFAIGFVMWLITQSIFHLGTLCPWCMAVWSAVIPMAIGTTLYNVRAGNLPLGRGAKRAAAAVYGWTPLATLVSYVVVAVLAQVRLDVLATL